MKDKSIFDDFFLRVTQLTPIKNQAQLAKELGVGRAAISIAKQKNTIPPKWIFELSSRYGINPSYLLSGQGEPYIGTSETEKNIIIEPMTSDKISISNQILNIKLIGIETKLLGETGYFYIIMQENSMYPHILPGDFLIVKKSQTFKPGDIGVIELSIDQGPIMLIRRISANENSLILIADNDRYPILAYKKDNIKILGKVIGIYRKI